MKKKIVNGILLVAMLFATTSAFVSCKDTDSDMKAELDAKYAALEKKFNDLQTKVDGIKSCDCSAKLASLQQAIEDVKKLIPSVDGFVKTSDLSDLLKDFVTKAYVDDAIAKAIAGIEHPASLTENDVNALIAKALDAYTPTPTGLTEADVIKLINNALANYKPEIPAGLTTEDVNNLIAEALKKYKPEVTGGLTADEVNKLIEEALKKFKEENPIPEAITKEEIITIINETIDTTDAIISNVYETEVTSLHVDQVSNQMVSLITPLGIKVNVLLAFFGDKAKRNLYFPASAEEPIVWKGDYYIEKTGNAGKIYVTVNPSSVDFSTKILKLVTTNGEEGPVELSGLEASTQKLMFLTRGTNAFYEAYANIPAEKIAKAYISWEPTDILAWKEDIKTLMHERDKVETVNMIEEIYNLIVGNDIPAYRLQATWGKDGKEYYTYSEANIAALAIKPLTYAFDLADEYEYDGDNITALESFEEKVVYCTVKNESTQSKIFHFLDKFNKEVANKFLSNINWSLQPTLLIEANNEVSHPDVYGLNMSVTVNRYQAGEIKLMPTSWSAEIFAPAFKKFVAVVEVNGRPISEDSEEYKEINKGYLGKVIPGSVKEIPLTIEAGKTYKIQYSAVDFGGNVRNLYYMVRGFNND
jgi:hypothetical protein